MAVFRWLVRVATPVAFYEVLKLKAKEEKRDTK
jgi:hypothetical protein